MGIPATIGSRLMGMQDSARDYVGISAVIERFGASYLAANRTQMPGVQVAALMAMKRCRTKESGARLYQCSDCGLYAFVYHSCRHRACPKCGYHRNQEWIAARARELLPVDYLQIVVTVPKGLQRIIKSHQPELYGVLLKAAGRSIQKVIRSRHGLKVGVMSVLHTWGRALVYHPHVHNAVTAGGLTSSGDWCSLKHDAKGLARLIEAEYRETFLKLAKAAVPGLQLPGSAGTTKWSVYVGASRADSEALLAYLGHHVHQTALSDYQVLAIEGGNVRIRYVPSGSTAQRTMLLNGHEFLRRVLQHVPAKGFHRIRYYGLWSPACRAKLRELQRRLPAREGASSTPAKVVQPDEPRRCPHCRKLTLEHVDDLAPGEDAEAIVANLNANIRRSHPPPRAMAP